QERGERNSHKREAARGKISQGVGRTVNRGKSGGGPMSIVADKIKRIKLSPSVAARAIIAELREQGRRIIDLTVGEPDFPTPAHIRQAAVAAMERGETKYPPAQGTAALRQARSEEHTSELQSRENLVCR